MNLEVRTEWVRLLRFGDYRQGHGYLHRLDEDGTAVFCCLGVLCDLAVRAGVVDARRGSNLVRYGAVGEVGALPNEVVEWAGLSSVDPPVVGRTLSSWNDGDALRGLEPVGFKRIADLIEAQL